MTAKSPILADLTEPRPLDVDAELDRCMLTAGIVQALCAGAQSPHAMTREEVWDVLWRRIPFLKALCALGREHRLELAVRWKQALQEPMPFGGAPLGLPEGEEP